MQLLLLIYKKRIRRCDHAIGWLVGWHSHSLPPSLRLCALTPQGGGHTYSRKGWPEMQAGGSLNANIETQIDKQALQCAPESGLERTPV